MLSRPTNPHPFESDSCRDPEARRFMWNVISRISTKRKQSSIILTTHSMEEAEALSTKMAIQVDGELKCIGSIQHLKSKFSEGYEVEIKTNSPSSEEIEKKFSLIAQGAKEKSGYALTSVVKQQELAKVAESLQLAEAHVREIKPDGIGSQLYQQLINPQGMLLSHLIEYVLVEEQGQAIKDFIGSKLGEYLVIEHFQTFYRFKIKTQVSVGKVFGIFEKSKAELNIVQYSVKQATIEQIFNLFAEGKIDDSQNIYVRDYRNQVQISLPKSMDLEMVSVEPNPNPPQGLQNKNNGRRI